MVQNLKAALLCKLWTLFKVVWQICAIITIILSAKQPTGE